MRELVIQPLPGIGDMVWHLPHIHVIAAANPDGHVDVLTKRRSLADRLLAADPAVAEVLWLERGDGRHAGFGGLLRLARELRARHYQRAWILHNSARYALAAWLAGIPERIGYGFGVQKCLVRRGTRLADAQRSAHPIDKAAALLARAGLPSLEAEPRLVLDSDLRARIAARYAACPRPWFALGIGSSEPAKQWGAEKFAALAQQLTARGCCFLIGGPDETELAGAIAGRVEGGADRVLTVTDQPIDAVAALLSLCDRYVGNDTGVLNLAAAVGVRCVGIFGASMPLRHSRRIRCVEPAPAVDMDRRGAGMYAGGERGMAAIGVAEVVRTLDEQSE